MTTALYDQAQLGDLDTPVFNDMLLEHESLLDYITSGDWAAPDYKDPAIMELAFEVNAAHFELAPSQIPTVAQIETDIEAGIVPVVIEDKHRKGDDEDQPEPEEEKQAAFASAGNRDS